MILDLSSDNRSSSTKHPIDDLSNTSTRAIDDTYHTHRRQHCANQNIDIQSTQDNFCNCNCCTSSRSRKCHRLNNTDQEVSKMCIACDKATSSCSLNSSLHSITSSSVNLELETTSITTTSDCSTGSSPPSSPLVITTSTSVSGDNNSRSDNHYSCISTVSSNSSSVCISPVNTETSESTESVDDSDVQSQDTVASLTPRGRRRVHFAPNLSIPSHLDIVDDDDDDDERKPTSCTSYPVHTDIIDTIQPASSMTDHERSQAFWQLKDYEYFRGTAQIIASEVLKVTASQPPSTNSYNSVMTRTYDLCAVISESSFTSQEQVKKEDDEEDENKVNHSATSTSSSSDHEHEEFVIPPHLFAALTHWVKAGHSRRGLEKFCVTSHIRSRPMAKAATVQAVLLAQDYIRNKQLQEEDENSTDTTKKITKFHIGNSEFPLDLPQDEILRLVSQRFSQTSRYYGTAIGHADAAAVGNYQHCSKNSNNDHTQAKKEPTM